MQFVADGPDIPESLLQAHEEGRVVFFCGAGISCAAGLPLFDGLVNRIYSNLRTDKEKPEIAAEKSGRFDETLELLERRLVGGSEVMRKALFDELQLDPLTPLSPGALTNHHSIVTLARDRNNTMRLVTTNFDRLFDQVLDERGLNHETHPAPFLPVPKNSKWNGLVYLHGRLPEQHEPHAMQRLVITSGDFGLAYLQERWAARFVSLLCQNYVVCFVGYRIGDPVIRYMMDALAADRRLGESTPQAYAFGSYNAAEEGAKDKAIEEWKLKGVTPILYQNNNGHAALRNTLQAWAGTYQAGAMGKQQIITQHAAYPPSASTKDDDQVSRVLWALADTSGLPARHFADMEPVPPLSWLKELEKERFNASDLPRFGIGSQAPENTSRIPFSLLRRPAPFTHSPPMAMFTAPGGHCEFDSTMEALARWLTRHLNDPELLLWVANRGGGLHPRLVTLIDRRLEHLASLERDGKHGVLQQIRSHAPSALPNRFMKALWQLLLQGKVRQPGFASNLFSWLEQVRRYGLTPLLRMQVRDLLAPCIELHKPYAMAQFGLETTEPTKVTDLVRCELVLVEAHVISTLRSDEGQWSQITTADMVPVYQRLLLDALELLAHIEIAGPHSDNSIWDMPSIEPHWQNRHFADWVVLIELLRDSWLSMHQTSPAQAARVAEDWFNTPYPTFKRLALFAASRSDSISCRQWISWLTDNNEWLWSIETQRESLRLLASRCNKLPKVLASTLTQAILSGPARSRFRDDVSDEEFRRMADRGIWLRLAKWAGAGGALTPEAEARYRQLSEAHPQWDTREDQREEFAHWMSGSGDPGFEDDEWPVPEAPSDTEALLDWLKDYGAPTHQDLSMAWRRYCQSQPQQSLAALTMLSDDGTHTPEQWAIAISSWSGDKEHQTLWPEVSNLIPDLPDDVLREAGASVARWCLQLATNGSGSKRGLYRILRRLLAVHFESPEPGDQAFSISSNHALGLMARTVIAMINSGKPKDGMTLRRRDRQLLNKLCNPERKHLWPARVQLTSNLVFLYRIDPQWTSQHLLPLLAWDGADEETVAAWQGFLWAPRTYLPLLEALATPLVETARHYQQLGEAKRHYAQFITFAALNRPPEGSTVDYRAAVRELPEEGALEAANTLARAIEGAGDKKAEYWLNRIKPFWTQVWPQDRSIPKAGLVESLARVCIAAGTQFPDAVDTVRHWLSRHSRTDRVVMLLMKSGLCKLYPTDSLTLLDAAIEVPLWAREDLSACLSEIERSEPDLKQDPRYRRLNQIAQSLER